MYSLDNRIIMDAFVIFLGIMVIWFLVTRYQSRRKKLTELIKQQDIMEDRIKKAIQQSEPTTRKSTADNGD